jgi:hypothetical protein
MRPEGIEVGSGTRRRPIGRDFAAAKDGEVGMKRSGKSEWGSGNFLKWEFGMRPSTSSDEAKWEKKRTTHGIRLSVHGQGKREPQNIE